MPADFSIPEWSYAYGGPSGTGDIKTIHNDFIVEEILPFTAEGSGEHVFLQIDKCGENTEYVARLLARFAGVRQRDIGFAGLKDRHARTIQWFSIWLPGKQEPDWSQVQTENITILQITRHTRKLKRGVIAANQFKIRIRNWQGDSAKAKNQLQLIRQQGFPNYFGNQRFGRQGQNVNKALALFQGRKVKREQRSIYLSAVRSYLFNLILAKRVTLSNWNQLLSGDVCQLDHSHSIFKVESVDQSLHERIKKGDIHSTAVMYGKGEFETSEEAGAIEKAIISKTPELVNGLLKYGLAAERRALRAMPEQLSWQFEDSNQWLLCFRLPAGSYATALLREWLMSEKGKPLR